MNSKTLYLLIVMFATIIVLPAFGQDPIEKYIDEAFRNNSVIKEKTISLEKSLISLKEAKGLFLPVTSFDAQYLVADGGRSIDIPVGNLMNPVYSTLNELVGSQKFPQINNVSEQLNPNNFYDVRIKTVMPLFNPEIGINRDIKKQEITLRQYEIDIYKRELVKDVKIAYFNFLTATKAISIYESALGVVRQNLKVNTSLLRNGKGLPAYVSRAEAEVDKVELQLEDAVKDQTNARSYFNFLLNKALDAEIVVPSEDVAITKGDSTNDINQREELKSLSVARDINNKVLKMNQSFRKPRLNAFLDVGAQDFDFTVNNKSLFYLGGLQLKVPIFSGKSNLYKIEQSKLDAKYLELREDNNIKQLQLAASVSGNNLDKAQNAYQSLVKQEESSQKYFRLIDRGFQEGINSFIEFLDARNQLTTIQLQLNIQKYRVFTALADYERQTASYTLK